MELWFPLRAGSHGGGLLRGDIPDGDRDPDPASEAVADARGAGGFIVDGRLRGRRWHVIVEPDADDIQGIVVFEWLGPPKQFGATGHVDLFSVVDRGEDMTPQFTPACEGNCYWLDDTGPMVAHLWETAP